MFVLFNWPKNTVLYQCRSKKTPKISSGNEVGCNSEACNYFSNHKNLTIRFLLSSYSLKKYEKLNFFSQNRQSFNDNL